MDYEAPTAHKVEKSAKGGNLTWWVGREEKKGTKASEFERGKKREKGENKTWVGIT